MHDISRFDQSSTWLDHAHTAVCQSVTFNQPDGDYTSEQVAARFSRR